jgi:hypothetical protein
MPGATGACATRVVLKAGSRMDKIQSERGERKERNDGLIVLLWHGSAEWDQSVSESPTLGHLEIDFPVGEDCGAGGLQKVAAENRMIPTMIERAGRRSHFIGKLLLIMAASLAVTSFAQTPALPPATAPPLAVTAVAAAPPVFEVTTVKLNKSGNSGSHSSLDNGRFIASNILLKNARCRYSFHQ